jgi:hypothetical protein
VGLLQLAKQLGDPLTVLLDLTQWQGNLHLLPNR